MISIGGLPFSFAPMESFSSEERELLASIRALDVPVLAYEPIAVELRDEPPWRPTPDERAPAGGPAALSFDHDSVRVAHDDVIGEFGLSERRLSYARFTEAAAPLRIMLRTAFVAALPIAGGLPLHCAALVRGDEAYVFFGESGAGKSTIAEVSALPLVSEEIVALTSEGDHLAVRATGFREIRPDQVVAGPIRVSALVELGKGSRFDARPLDSAEATQALLKVILAPPHPIVWQAALATLNAVLGTGTPVVRMEWSPELSPLPQLEEWLARSSR